MTAEPSGAAQRHRRRPDCRLGELLDSANQQGDARAGAHRQWPGVFLRGWIRLDAPHAGLQRGRASGRRPGASPRYCTNWTPRLPTIASVQVRPLALAPAWVACCDVAVATAEALFGFSEVRLGLIPASTAPYVVRAIGERSARRYFITAERFNAEKASAWGWGAYCGRARSAQRPVTYRPKPWCATARTPLPAAGAAAMCGQVIDQRLVDFTAERIAHARASDAKTREGVAALLEKRKPNWRGLSRVAHDTQRSDPGLAHHRRQYGYGRAAQRRRFGSFHLQIGPPAASGFC